MRVKTVDIIFHYYLKDITDYELNMLVHHMASSHQ